jgi:hypothetical protein
MPVPRSWERVLHGPSYLINLDARRDRLVASLKELHDAEFTNVLRFAAIDAHETLALERAWAPYGTPRFAEWDGAIAHVLGKQGCFLSHLGVWQEIIDRNLPHACVFEDDVIFHPHWAQIAPTAFAFTPQDYDLLYMGSLTMVEGTGLVRRVPVYGMHGYVVTREGALKLRSHLLDDPEGIGSIDIMLWRLQEQALAQRGQEPLSWYVWDGTAFHGHRDRPHPDRLQSELGLIFQDGRLGSDIEGRS